MERHGEEVELTATEARGAQPMGVMRWVLILSTLLAIIALTLIWITGAISV
jgi:hypothetical protein